MNNISNSPLFFDYDRCKAYTRLHAKSFYFSSFLLPKEKRNAAYAVYAFCRYADDLVDHSKIYTSNELQSKYGELLNYLEDVFAGKLKSNSLNQVLAFTDAVSRFKIPKHYFTDLIEGVMMDITKKRYATFMELDTYCYKVASVVGLMMSEIFGYSNKAALPYAIYLGKAMQLTNILRDVNEDFQMGRIYLPGDEMKCFEYSEEDLSRRVLDERFMSMIKFNIDRTKAFYELASHGLPYLTNDGSRTTAILMNKIYSGILTEIENHNYDVFSKRHYVGTLGKLRLTGSYLLSRKERKRYTHLPVLKQSERIRALAPELNFDE